MKIYLIKSPKGESVKSNILEEIILVDIEHIITFPVQILRKENGDFIPVLPRRNRKYENGVDTEYIYFKDDKSRKKILTDIINKYKKQDFYIKEEVKDEETGEIIEEPINEKLIKVEFKKIEKYGTEYVKFYLNLSLDNELTIKGFKFMEIDNNYKITPPNFLVEKDLCNRFELNKKVEGIIINQYFENLSSL